MFGKRKSLAELVSVMREEARERHEERVAETRRWEERWAAETQKREREARRREAEAQKREAEAQKREVKAQEREERREAEAAAREAEARRRGEETREFNREILLRNEKVYTGVIRRLEKMDEATRSNVEETRAQTKALLRLLDRLGPPGDSLAA
ncbi:MAG TPA: hypothetical protein VF731_11390 [Solirubrobacterales bacterium]